MFQLNKKALILVIIMNIKEIKKALYYSLLFLTMAIIGISTADAAEPSQDFQKSEEIGKGSFDGLKDALNSPMVSSFAEKSKDAIGGLFHGAKESLAPSDGLCSEMSRNYKTVKNNDWWMSLGAKIQNAAQNGDAFVLQKRSDMSHILDKFSPGFTENAGGEKTGRIYKTANVNEIAKRWDKFWKKKGTLGSIFSDKLGTYRCIGKNSLSNGEAFNNAVMTAIDIAEHLGDKNAQKKFTSMVNNFTN